MSLSAACPLKIHNPVLYNLLCESLSDSDSDDEDSATGSDDEESANISYVRWVWLGCAGTCSHGFCIPFVARNLPQVSY
jgi:hypothetical protein